jgi:hypothetical protein
MTRWPLLPLVLGKVPPGLVQALAQEGTPFVDQRQAHGAGRFVLYDSRRESLPRLLPGQRAIDVDLLRQNETDDPFELLLDERSAPANWQIGGLQAVEEIAAIDKRGVRQRLMARLRKMLEAAGAVWMKLAAYPYPYQSTFNFRIDHDDYHAADFVATLDAIRGREDATSHFVCGIDFQDQSEAAAALRGLDVGSHGFWHHTYRDAADNRRNIERGIAVLQAAGIEPSGFVAPHGRFNRGLLAVLNELKIGHSSEFALAYDDLPFFPRGGSVLQIPVHPVCLGIILEAARRESPHIEQDSLEVARVIDAACEYFAATMSAKHAAGEPLFLYCHPTGRLGRYPQVLRRVFDAADHLPRLWRTTYTTFARWWGQRAVVRPRVHQISGGYEVTAESLPPEFTPALEVWRQDRVAVLPLSTPTARFDPAALDFQHRVAIAAVLQPERIPRRGSLKGRLLQSIDWEKATPLHEIRIRSWRGLVKKSLRYIKS